MLIPLYTTLYRKGDLPFFTQFSFYVGQANPSPKSALPNSARDVGSGTAFDIVSPLEIMAVAEVVVSAR